MNISSIAKSVRTTMIKHSPEILTGIGIAGMLATTVLAVKATPKAMKLIELVKENQEEPKKIEYVKATWKCYIPAALTGISSIACLIGASSVNAKRNAALAAAYTLSDTALREYREKVIETIGDKKEQTIIDAIAQDKIDNNPVSNNEVIVTGGGTTLCYDAISGRYFESDINKLKKIENELNSRLLREDYISLNEFYYELGLLNVTIGDDLGWNISKGLVELYFSSMIADDGRPCLIIQFSVAPMYDYYR